MQSAQQQPPQPRFKLLTKKQTAAFFDVTERTIDRWLLDGIIPAKSKIVIGGSVRFKLQILLDDIDAQGSASDAAGK